MTELEKMQAGRLYNALDPEIRKVQEATKTLIQEYNHTRPEETEKRQAILKSLFGTVGSRVLVENDFKCDFGFNIHIKGRAFIHCNCVMMDSAPINFGNDIFIGPDCCFVCKELPMNAEERNAGLAYARPITVEDSVWIGANCSILGGVTIGKGSVIGAGSVVVSDIPAGVVAAGNPCRVLHSVEESREKEE